MDILRRFLNLALKEDFPPGSVEPSDVWSLAVPLFDLADQRKRLAPDAIALLGDLATGLRLPIGAPAPLIAAVLERSFGPCPLGPERLAVLADWLREERNGTFSTLAKKKGPAIGGEW